MVLRTLLLVLGIVEILKPRELVDLEMRLATRGDDPVELREWVYTAARVEGIFIILWVLGNAIRRSRSSDDEEAVAVVEAA